MKNPTFNPYLPSYEYIPDGEPHVFNDRLYIYGSHDKYNGKAYCEKDYAIYSAPINDLSAFRFEGTSFKSSDDPNKNRSKQLWAPDVCKGPDGNYYLFYCKAFSRYIGVARASKPEGPFQYIGNVKYNDGVNYGFKEGDLPFDPGVLVDDDGRIYLYTGFASTNKSFQKIAKLFFGIKITGDCAFVIELDKDMLTIKTVKEFIPGPNHAVGTSFENHAFYEASSMRKFNGKYYFIYSTEKSHELGYAMSEYPDRGFKFKGILHSNGNLGIDNVATYPWGNNHGSIECINGEYYIFGHRQTNYHEYSRQGVAEKIFMDENGEFKQAEMTSYGISGKPLATNREYSSGIACVLMPKNGACKVTEIKDKKHYPMIVQNKKDGDTTAIQFITHITDGAIIGYKYFDFYNTNKITIQYSGKANGKLFVFQNDCNKSNGFIGKFNIEPKKEKSSLEVSCDFKNGVFPLYFKYEGEGSLDLFSFSFK